MEDTGPKRLRRYNTSNGQLSRTQPELHGEGVQKTVDRNMR
jgi:hypothetical protein